MTPVTAATVDTTSQLNHIDTDLTAWVTKMQAYATALGNDTAANAQAKATALVGVLQTYQHDFQEINAGVSDTRTQNP